MPRFHAQGALAIAVCAVLRSGPLHEYAIATAYPSASVAVLEAEEGSLTRSMHGCYRGLV